MVVLTRLVEPQKWLASRGLILRKGKRSSWKDRRLLGNVFFSRCAWLLLTVGLRAPTLSERESNRESFRKTALRKRKKKRRKQIEHASELKQYVSGDDKILDIFEKT